MAYYLAVDIGAESGRLILGSIENGRLSMREIHRFDNGMLEINGHYFWNIGNLYAEILKGIQKCVHAEGIVPDSIAIDTWGVDYGLLAGDGSLLGLPFAYRDPRTQNSIFEFCEIISQQELYERTGNLLAQYNTIFQLYSATHDHPKMLEAATDLLFIPDLLAYFLTGKKATEFSFATTSQLYNRNENTWDRHLIGKLNLPVSLMQEVIPAGTVIGNLNKTVTGKISVPAIPVVAVASHDTASAIVSIPVSLQNKAFISSGTWSLMGIETDQPLIFSKTLNQNFTNEGGFGGRNYLLKNLMGLWVLQQCRQSMHKAGREYNYPELVKLAELSTPFFAFIDVDDESFLNPNDMCKAIDDYCAATHQAKPVHDGQYVRIVLESLAFKYKQTLLQLQEYQQIDELYLTGGGINNRVLCQYTANACKMNVTTFFAEGSAAGNLIVQAFAMGKLSGSGEMNKILMNSCVPEKFYAEEENKWSSAFNRYLSATQ